MSYIDLTPHQFNPESHWDQPLNSLDVSPARELALFDLNGYYLTDLEQRYAEANLMSAHAHREHPACTEDAVVYTTGAGRRRGIESQSVV